MRPALESKGGLLGEENEQHDLVLGAPALLGIFFAVAVVCAVCFGFGYSQGHGWRIPGAAAEKAARPELTLGSAGVSASAAPKPAPGVGVAELSATSEEASGEVPSRPKRESPSAAAPARPAPAPAGSPLPEAAPAANLMVQIAAVNRSADAETLARALRHDGFAAMVRTSTGDSFFHVQVGPFATLAAAKAMRARLADSGYNAFVKP